MLALELIKTKTKDLNVTELCMYFYYNFVVLKL